ncbi:hypothetical protein Ddye_002562 [Dipteronia dyeriana]|uniref:Retrotransposon Copia-like N-terminal domain-containing protein n=1 Tax=Dipteronia dyeriana TaxID=168575 RepID=A0AAE0CV44_9ROSI|nr:hypothetical protein Ddye_002562 [Dipteronia dyeriana]
MVRDNQTPITTSDSSATTCAENQTIPPTTKQPALYQERQVQTLDLTHLTRFFSQRFPSLSQSLSVKLDHSNYMIWKNQLLNVAIANGLEDFIYGTLPCPQKFQDPAQTIVNPSYGQWLGSNHLVMSWIYSSTSEVLMGQIVGHSTAYDILAALQKLCESTSTTKIMGMRSQLQKIKKEGISLTQYLAQMKEITDKFAAIGDPLSYRDHLGYLLELFRYFYPHQN